MLSLWREGQDPGRTGQDRSSRHCHRSIQARAKEAFEKVEKAAATVEAGAVEGRSRRAETPKCGRRVFLFSGASGFQPRSQATTFRCSIRVEIFSTKLLTRALQFGGPQSRPLRHKRQDKDQKDTRATCFARGRARLRAVDLEAFSETDLEATQCLQRVLHAAGARHASMSRAAETIRDSRDRVGRRWGEDGGVLVEAGGPGRGSEVHRKGLKDVPRMFRSSIRSPTLVLRLLPVSGRRITSRGTSKNRQVLCIQ